MKLRPYQVRSLDATRGKIARGSRRLVYILPTGGGKTVVASEIIRGAIAKGKRVLFLAHRKELIDQCYKKLVAFGVVAGVLMGTDKRRDDFLPVQIASVQTLRNRLDKLPEADIVIIDECHHSTATTYRKIIDAYPNAVVLGLTATPWGVGLADIYSDSVLAATPAELMELGALVRYDAFAYDSPELHDIGTTRGEFDQKELALACNTTILVGSVVREYMTHASGRRAILFPVNVEHSLSLVAEFQSFGIKAEHVDANTPKVERERILEGLASGAVTIVSSVGVLTEGFDCPAAEVCILARPTQSLILHLQMIGRVLRPCDGKMKALIHDHAGNLIRHGFPEDERDYSLQATPKRDRLLHTCPFCCLVFGALKTDGTCPHCGQLIEFKDDLKEDAGIRATKVVVDGKRLTVDEVRELRASKGARVDLTDEQIIRIASATMEEKAAEYKRLRVIAEKKAYADGWADHRYRETFGVWPRFGEQYHDVKPAAAPIVPLSSGRKAA